MDLETSKISKNTVLRAKDRANTAIGQIVTIMSCIGSISMNNLIKLYSKSFVTYKQTQYEGAIMIIRAILSKGNTCRRGRALDLSHSHGDIGGYSIVHIIIISTIEELCYGLIAIYHKAQGWRGVAFMFRHNADALLPLPNLDIP